MTLVNFFRLNFGQDYEANILILKFVQDFEAKF